MSTITETSPPAEARERTTNTCPTCGAGWAVAVETFHTELRRGDGFEATHAHGRERKTHALICEFGHEYQIVKERTRLGMSGTLFFTVVMPEPQGELRAWRWPERPAGGPCKGCGKPIQPRQLYVVGPRHIGC